MQFHSGRSTPGSLLQTLGPATVKDLSPSCVMIIGTSHVNVTMIWQKTQNTRWLYCDRFAGASRWIDASV